MTRRDFKTFCLSLPGVYEDWPFGEDWLAVRHSGNKKGCAFIYEREGTARVNLKCEPMQADFWRGVYEGVRPGYHMNKTHWNTVLLEADVPDEELRAMVLHSYSLTAPKKRKAAGGNDDPAK